MKRVLVVALAVGCAACSTPPTTSKPHVTSASARPSAAPSSSASTRQLPTASPTTGTTAVPTGTPAPTLPPLVGGLQGSVLGLDGQPAIGVLVHLVSDSGSAIMSNNGGSYHLMATEAHTDAAGRFALDAPASGAVAVEAVQADDVKALKLGVSAGSVQLQLAYTGTITGKLAAPDAPLVTNFQGVDVYLPGSSYGAKAAQDGSFTISNVPIGSFNLVASHEGMGAGQAKVEVKSRATADVGTLALHLDAPVLKSLSVTSVKGGGSVTLTGERFGASTNAALTVTVGGVQATAVRQSDTTIVITVPATAPSGDVVVTVGTVPSAPLKLTVLKDATEARVSVLAGVDQGGFLDGPVASAAFDTGARLAIAPAGTLFLLDHDALRTIASGIVSTIAGSAPDDGPQEQLGVSAPTAIAADAHGRVLLVDGDAGVLRITPGGSSEVLVPADKLDDSIAGVAVDGADQVYLLTDSNELLQVPAAGKPSSLVEELDGAVQLLGDPAGGVWVLSDDALHHVSPQGQVTEVGSVKGLAGASAFAVGPNGTFYVADQGDAGARIRAFGTTTDTLLQNSQSAFSTEGPASSVTLDTVTGLVVDALGNLVFADDTTSRIHQLTLFSN